ncbi:MAG: restriction endonuclease subunit S [Anaerovoracaceae bacterium]
MNKKEQIKVVPKYRFPEFQNSDSWERCTLAKLADRIEEKVGENVLTTLSISAGTGFVSQEEKFSRDISGNQYKNYIHLRKGDFSYNKGNSKTFPQGCIYQLTEYEEAAVPNAFISFHFKDNYVSNFYKGYFENNFHGKQLTRFITSGARMDGLLNIKAPDFFSIVLPTPTERKEQQKIADCLASIDDLISAEDKQLSALKVHKKGLMQKLFPAEGKTVPEWRFPEFRNSGRWEKTSFKKVFAKFQYGLNASAKKFDGRNKYIRITDIDETSRRYLFKNVVSPDCELDDTYLVREGDILFARTGASVGKTYIYAIDDGILYFAGFLIRGNVNAKYCAQFIFAQTLSTNYQKWVAVTSTRSGQPGINATEYESFAFFCPSLGEQQKISDFLSSVDELITAQAEKIEALKKHKKGLMQGLFPSIEEVIR